MPWGAILAAFRNAFAHRGAQLGRRAPQVANQTRNAGTRPAPSQAKPAAKDAAPKETKTPAKAASVAHKPPIRDDWDFMVMDVCFLAKM